ncbi:hypothetical protein NO135_20795, partial [Clostridioides difficile]|nr:hypothetical protein [Clostridioides difficile]
LVGAEAALQYGIADLAGKQPPSYRDLLGGPVQAHPALVAAFAEGAQRYGSGSGGSHLLGGHSRAHATLEDDLAAFSGGFSDAPRALYFSTGYMANLAAMTALTGKGATIFS